ncbi:hypothetical protein SODG_000156 [Sodalis praecaptivus]
MLFLLLFYLKITFIRGKGLLNEGLCADKQLSKKGFIPFVQASKNERFGFKHVAVDGKWLYVYADHIRFLTRKRHRVNGVRVQGYTANGVRVDMVA